VLLGVLVLALLPVGYVGFGLASTLFAISHPGDDAGSGLPQGSGDLHGTNYVLLLGSDERHDNNGNIVAGEVPHSDTMILLAVDMDHKAARMLSVPRDLLVTIPGFGSGHRINEAYTLGETRHMPGGGPALAVRTMSELTGISIPYYAVTTFDGFRQTVDAVGGVTIDVARPISDHDYPGEHNEYKPVYIPAGLQLMSGEPALEYVRSRHDDPLGDLGRNQRQQLFLNALSHKLLKPERLAQFNQFMDIAKRNIRTNLSPGQILSVANNMVGAGKGAATGYAVDYNYVRDPTPAEATAYGAVLIPNKAAIARLVRAFTDGTPPPSTSPTPSG
jgi:LCP family protein required for cell wall assembly